MNKLFKISFLLSFYICNIYAIPQGMHIKHGQVETQKTDDELVVKSSPNTVLHWDKFSIDKHEHVNFILENKDSKILNRVVGSERSDIFGSLSSNGKVFLINPNGVLIGKDSKINVRSFAASTLDVLDSDFLHGQDLLFSGTSDAEIINLGTIEATDIVLLAKKVNNGGTLKADNISIGGGYEFLLSTDGVLIPADSKGLKEVKDSGNAYSLVVNSGIIDASTVESKNGHIYLVADHVYLSPISKIKANNLENGDGGNIKIWGNETAQGYGIIEAKGGPEGGNGGFIELSAEKYINPVCKVDTSAPKGTCGQFLLDPDCDIFINTNATSGAMAPPFEPVSTTGSPVNINNTDLEGWLALSNVIITTVNTTGGGVGDIVIQDAEVIWNNSNSLTLNASNNFSINAPTADTGIKCTSNGDITINAKKALKLGVINQDFDSYIQSSGGNINLSLEDLRLQEDPANTGSTFIDAGGGNIDINSKRIITISAGGVGSDAYIKTTGDGYIFIKQTGGLLSIDGGNSLGSQAYLQTQNGFIQLGSKGSFELEIIRLTGGQGLGSQSFIETTGTGEITSFTMDELDISSRTAPAFIKGNSIDITSKDISLLGRGAAGFGKASIESTGGNISLDCSGTIRINAVETPTPESEAYIKTTGTGIINIKKATSGLYLGSINSEANTYIQTESGDIIGSNLGTVYLQGGILNGNTNITSASNSISLDCANLNIIAGGGGEGFTDAYILAGSNVNITSSDNIIIGDDDPMSAINANSFIRAVDISIDFEGNLLVKGGANSGAISAISSLGDIQINKTTNNFRRGNILVKGGSAIGGNSFAIIESPQGSLSLNVNSIGILGGTGTNSFALIESGLDCNMRALSLLMLSGDGTNSRADLNITGFLDADILGFLATRGTSSNPALLKAMSGSDISVGRNVVFGPFSDIIPGSSGPITITAGLSMLIGPNSQLSNINNIVPVKLAVDLRAGDNVGNGRFILLSDSSISTSGELLIYTAKRSQNIIQTDINGNFFDPNSPEFENTSQQVWGIAFDNGTFGGPGYTVFYKNLPLPPSPDFQEIQQANSADAEFFDIMRRFMTHFLPQKALFKYDLKNFVKVNPEETSSYEL